MVIGWLRDSYLILPLTWYFFSLFIDKVFERIAEDFMKTNKAVSSGMYKLLYV